MYTEEDCHEIKSRGISVDDIEKQLSKFSSGFPFLPVARPATTGDGILEPREDTLEDFINLYDSNRKEVKTLKFVPASGAATRMFRNLYSFLEKDGDKEAADELMVDFISGISDFAFYDDLKIILADKRQDIGSLISNGDYGTIVKTLLDKDGLNYSQLPKGLIPFHKYGNSRRTAFEEHLAEGAMYCRGKNDEVHIHMTVSPEHKEAFIKVLEETREKFEKELKVKYNVSFSVQKPSTDTIAADSDNQPFRNKKGKLVFRPGGHGALLDNLAVLDAELIFIKNIDNVVPDHFKDETVKYKKALGGILLSFRERIFYYLGLLSNNSENNPGMLEEIRIFLEEELCMIPPWAIDQWPDEEVKRYLISKLNRPLRVCGMVKNAGEPGGGPFWVKNSDGSVSLQIVESSQINLSNPLMKKLFDASTHFNPVDLVCSINDFNGNKFDLHRFTDPETGFISTKSLDGRELKALELPGLWNGAMSDWITVFVEMPLSTFNPVKTIADLLRPRHREEKI